MSHGVDEIELILSQEEFPVAQRRLYDKAVIVGDAGIGKTCFCLRYANARFATDYIPTIFDGFAIEAEYRGSRMDLTLWDTADYDRLRPLSYPETAVFLMAFSLVDPVSFKNLVEKFIPEVRQHEPSVPLLLIGLKSDLLREPSVVHKLHLEGSLPVTQREAVAFARECGAVGYFECSAKDGVGVNEVMEETQRIVVLGSLLRDRERRKKFGFLSKLFPGRRKSRVELMSVENQRLYADRILGGGWEEKLAESESKVRAMFDRERREAMSLQDLFSELPRELLLHILHDFVLIDLCEDVPSFRMDLIRFHSMLGLSDDPSDVLKTWFGVEGSRNSPQRRVIQLFCNFRIREFRGSQEYLPRHFRVVLVRSEVRRRAHQQDQDHVFLRSARAFYSRLETLQFARILWCSDESRFVERCGGTNFLHCLISDSVDVPSLPTQISTSLPRLCGLFVDVGPYLLSGGSPHVKFNCDFDLPELRNLDLSGFCVQGAEFKSSPLLTKIRLVEERFQEVSATQVLAISQLPHLRSLLLRRVMLRDSAEHLWKIVCEKPSLEEFVVSDCPFSFQHLTSWVLRGVPRLRVFILVCCRDEKGDVGDHQKSLPPDLISSLRSRQFSDSNWRNRRRQFRSRQELGIFDTENPGTIASGEESLLDFVVQSVDGGTVSNLVGQSVSEFLRYYEAEVNE